jgi:hypothetical protein
MRHLTPSMLVRVSRPTLAIPTCRHFKFRYFDLVDVAKLLIAVDASRAPARSTYIPISRLPFLVSRGKYRKYLLGLITSKCVKHLHS